jgi:hypothetical protein
MDSELKKFKTDINLQAYAAGQGYELDREASYKGLSMMRHPITDDKIAIKRDIDGHYLYYSNRDSLDNGSIIDFVMKRKHLSLGAVRKELRPWIGQPPVDVPVFAALHKTRKDRTKVEAAYACTKDAVAGHPYLENERGLSASLMALPRFAGRIRIDARANAVFPHFDRQGLCGYEIRNAGFKGFASGGTKGLWLSHEQPNDNRIVFCESAIDALSHAALFPDDHARYASIGGKLNPLQPELIRAAIARMPAKSKIVAAMDADADGAKLAEIIREAVQLTGRDDLSYVFQEPFGYKDWNDQLRKRPLQPLPSRVEKLSVA